MITAWNTIVATVLVGLCSVACLSSPARQGSQRASLDGARALLDQYRVSESYEAFAAHGTDAVDYIVALIRLETYYDARAQFLSGFLVKIPGREIDAALIQLLNDPSGRIRGSIAGVLGARRSRDAVPALIGALSDLEETGLVLVSAHEPTETPVLVRDEAVRALQNITDHTLGSNGTGEGKAEAWRSWWVTNASTWDLGQPK